MNETDTTFSFLLVASHLMREQIRNRYHVLLLICNPLKHVWQSECGIMHVEAKEDQCHYRKKSSNACVHMLIRGVNARNKVYNKPSKH